MVQIIQLLLTDNFGGKQCRPTVSQLWVFELAGVELGLADLSSRLLYLSGLMGYHIMLLSWSCQEHSRTSPNTQTHFKPLLRSLPLTSA